MPIYRGRNKKVKKIFKLYLDANPVLRIVIGLVLGALIGIFAPSWTVIGLFGEIFVGALKAIAPVLVFVLVISSLANAQSGIGKKFAVVIALYMLSTFLAATVAVLASNIFPITLRLASAPTDSATVMSIADVLKNLILNMIANPVGALVNANYTGILVWAIIIGIALKKASDTTKTVLSDISDSATKTVGWIILLAPFGIMGLVYSSVSANGLEIFTDYGRLLGVLVGCMLTIAFVVNPLIVAVVLRKNPYTLVLRCLKDSGITAFFTRSSAANIPVNMELCRKLGLNRDMYSVSIPLGATINMNGAAVTITVMTLAAANTLGINVDIPTALILSIIATLGACGSSGVTGGSLLLIPMACSLFSISNDIAMQVVGIGFIIGVVQDSFETALNSSGDVLFAATAELKDHK